MPSATALLLEEPRRLVPRDVPLPDVADDDAIVRVEACGLCGTDHEQYTGVLPVPGAFIPGHETVGTIERIGSKAADRWGVSEGDRVAVEVFQRCGACRECEAGEYRRCERHGLGDCYGLMSFDRPPGLWGGYATHQYLGPDTVLHRVPEGLDPVLATVFNPLGAGVRWAATVPGTTTGDVVAVLGPGIRGISSVVAAKEAGASFVMVTGTDRDADRLEIAKRFGADLVVDVTQQDPSRALKEATGGLADVVVDVTAKAPQAFVQAMSLARPAGTVVVAGTRGAEVAGFYPDILVYKELRIVGALGVDAPAYARALQILESNAYPFADLPRRVVGLDGLEELILQMAGESDGPPPVHGVLVP